MADPNTPTDPTAASIATQTGLTEAQVVAVEKLEKANRNLGASQVDLNSDTQNYSGILDRLNRELGDAGMKLENMGNLTGQQAVQFSLLSAALVTTTQKFVGMHDQLDPSRLGSFTDQTKTLIDTLSHAGPGTQLATDATKKLVGALTSMGAGGNAFTAAIKEGGMALVNFAKNVVTGADNTLRFQSIMMQGVAQGGGITQLYDGIAGSFEGVGKHLEHLNSVSAQLIDIQQNAAAAVGITGDQMSQYTATLLKTPGGLEAMTKGVDIAGQHTDALTAVYQLAKGAGLDVTETFQDVSKAALQTGMSYQDATKFAYRFADVSKDLHAPMADVHKALTDTTSAFKLWNNGGEQATKMNQGLADSVKNYAASLEAAGVPAQNALEIAKNQTAQMGQLSEAQESFISQQTGGAGGIHGALEFEELLKHDPAGAQRKIAESMKSAMGGKIVTREEALRTGQEDQYLKQRMMLTQGTLGMKAGSSAEADQMINAMAQGKQFKQSTPEDLAKAQAETVGKAVDQERLTYTGIKEANLTAERVMLQAGAIHLGTLEKAFSAGAGESANAGQGLNVAGQKQIAGFQQGASTFTGGHTPMMDTLKGMSKTMTSLPSLLGSGATSLKESVLGPGPQQGLDTSTAADNLGAQAQSQGISLAQAVKNQSKGEDTRPFFPMLGAGSTGTKPGGEPMLTAGKQVGEKVNAPATTAPGTAGAGTTAGRGNTGIGTGAGAGGPIPVTIAGGVIQMNLTGVCPHCKTPISTNLQGKATNVAANTE